MGPSLGTRANPFATAADGTAKTGRSLFQSVSPPTALSLPLEIGISARPLGSSHEKDYISFSDRESR